MEAGIREVLPMVDIFLPNRIELLRISKEENYEKAVLKLSRLVPMLVVKDGEKGSDAFVEGKIYHADAMPVKLADTVGAGNNFNVGFVYGYLSGFEISYCLKAAGICGNLSDTRYGGIEGQPRLGELKL